MEGGSSTMVSTITSAFSGFSGDLISVAAVAVPIGAAPCSCGWVSVLLASSPTMVLASKADRSLFSFAL